MQHSVLIIAGQRQGASGGATFRRERPGEASFATEAAAASPEDALGAASAAAAAFCAWSGTTASERAEHLMRCSEALPKNRERLYAAARDELGAAPGWIDFNIEVAQSFLNEAARMTDRLGNTPAGHDAAGNLMILRREPVGVVLGIAPWNAPIALATRAVATPLALGNTVVLKGSDLCPRTHQIVAEIFTEAGLPPGVLNFVTSAPEQAETVAEALIAHPAVRRVNFTGSTRVGRLIAVAAARHLKRCVLELSGKAPAVVLEDADIDQVARDVAFGAFFNAGQICMSTDRVIAAESIADALADRLRAEAEKLSGQRSPDGTTWHGSLISGAAGERLDTLLRDAERWGAKVLTGGRVEGANLAPTVVDHVSPACRLYREEVFGPIISILRVGSEDEAVSVANDCEYGLSAAVFSGDETRALRIAERIESGVCHINGPTVQDNPAMPFGGLKASGYGRLNGEATVEEFTELRWLTIRSAQGNSDHQEEEPNETTA